MAKFCPSCGKPLQFENAEICPSCGVRIQVPPPHSEIRDRFLAVVFSFFFPGWGQWYNGKTWDGLNFFAAFLGTYLLIVIFSIIGSDQALFTIFRLFLSIVIIGIWIYGMYDAYKTADKINKMKESFSRKSRLFWLPIALIVLVVLAAVIAAFAFGMAGSTQIVPKADTTYNVINTYTVVQTYATIETIVAPYFSYQRPSSIPVGYNYFKNDDLHFSVYLPNDWDSYIIDSMESTVISEDTSLSESTMPKIVYFYNKKIDATKSMIMIMGMDFTKSSLGDFSLQSFNDGFVGGLKQGLEKSQNTNIVITIKGAKYKINGYEALENIVTYTTSNGVPSATRIFVIKDGSKFYIIYYVAVNEEYGSQIYSVESIIKSFIPTQ